MSFQDIKEHYTEIQINGEIYKISYDFNALMRLEELFKSNFSNLPTCVIDLDNKSLSDLIEFCFVGFLKYQPSLEINTVKDYPFIKALGLKCVNEFSKAFQEPDEWAKTICLDGDSSDGKKKDKNLAGRGFISKLLRLG